MSDAPWPEKMLAAVRTSYGGPEVVSVREVPRPEPGPADVLVKIQVTTVNRTDAAYRGGRPKAARVVYGLPRPKVSILGCEYAGVVQAVGEEVTKFAVGDRVFGYNEGAFGGHAEYLSVSQDAPIAHVPHGVSLDHAAASTEGAHYALTTITKSGVVPGHRVLVNGGTGGIGSAAVQLSSHLGAHVTAVCGTDHVELVRALGAEHVIDYEQVDFTRMHFNADPDGEPQPFDVVIDAVGKSTFGACRRLLTPHGVYVSSELGPGAQNIGLALVGPLLRGPLRRRRVVFPIPSQSQAMVEHFAALLAAGDFTPLIDRTYPLAEIRDAYRYVDSGRKLGNVLIRVETRPGRTKGHSWIDRTANRMTHMNPPDGNR